MGTTGWVNDEEREKKKGTPKRENVGKKRWNARKMRRTRKKKKRRRRKIVRNREATLKRV